jgi:uncharacterized lipoprotein NlpE involved in copper resistance
MKHLKSISILILAVSLIVTTGCKPKKASEQMEEAVESGGEAVTESGEAVKAAVMDEHNSQNSLDWNGTYKGVIPCADCEGIRTSVTLMETGEFSLTRTYLGKEENPRTDSGTFQWDETGSKVTLVPSEGEPQMYQVGENILFYLDREGNRITGDLAEKYQLMKNRADYRLEDKKWILTELMGQEVTFGEGKKEAFLIFDSETGRVSGNNSCNVLSGGYELEEGDRIAIGQMAATLMACPDMEIADRLNQVLGKADNYTISDGVLSLNKARMAPMARFRLGE